MELYVTFVDEKRRAKNFKVTSFEGQLLKDANDFLEANMDLEKQGFRVCWNPGWQIKYENIGTLAEALNAFNR